MVRSIWKRGALSVEGRSQLVSVAFAPLYQLVKMNMHKRGLHGTGSFELTDKVLELTLELVLKALKP